jgi:hypothetical protein
VLAVVLFVVVLVAGDLVTPPVGARVRVALGAGGPAVLVGRCLEQRVTSIVLTDPGGRRLWRFDDDAGSIDRHYRVDAELPTTGTILATVTYDRGSPARAAIAADHLPLDPGLPRGTPPPCAGTRRLQPSTFLLLLGGFAVVIAYGAMLVRLVTDGRSGGDR